MKSLCRRRLPAVVTYGFPGCSRLYPMIKATILLLFTWLISGACHMSASDAPVTVEQASPAAEAAATFDTTLHTIHVNVALCDNQFQGIVPVPARIGNGRDPANNLYWGCAFGVSAFFRNSKDWQLLDQRKGNDILAERLIFRHKTGHWYLVADAYYGDHIKQCTIDFLNGCAGILKDTLHIKDGVLGIEGNSCLLAYIGHDGLMDFGLQQSFTNTDGRTRDAVILACISRKYFGPLLRQTGARPLLWSTGLMSPEAYTLHAALDAYVGGKPAADSHAAAAKAYARYQHCSEKAALGLLVSGY